MNSELFISDMAAYNHKKTTRSLVQPILYGKKVEVKLKGHNIKN